MLIEFFIFNCVKVWEIHLLFISLYNNSKIYIMNQVIIKKIEESFSTLQESNGKFFIHDQLNKMWCNDTDKSEILSVVHKILNLFNTSSTERQSELYHMEIEDVIKLV